jgi:hypothetical protein
MKWLRKVVVSLFLIGGISTGVTLGVGAAAGASTSQCSSGYACMWSSSGFTTYLWGNDVTTSYVGNSYNDQNDSTYDNTNQSNNVAWWADSGYSGYDNCNTPQSGDSNDSNLSTGLFSTFQNTISSMSFFKTGTTCSSTN